MADYAIVYQVLGVLLVLFFGFITYMNTKTWRWLHVMMVLLVFMMVPTFWVYAAMVMKTRKAWMTLYQKLDTEVKRYEDNIAILQRGEENDVKAERDSVYAKTEELRRLILDRGRVWRNCTPAGVQGGSLTLNVPAGVAPPPPPPMPMPMPMPMDPAAPADPNAPMDPNAVPPDPNAAQPMPMPMPVEPAAPVGGHNIVDKMVLYAFKEIDNPAGFKQPQFYIGEFWVTAVTPTTISIAPTMALAPEQLAEVNGGNASWMLFETCPIDTYEIFAGLDANAISQLIPQQETGLGPAEYTTLINSIVQDGQPAPENTSPDNLWVEVKFTKTHKEDVDAATANDTPDLMPFDNSGLAQPNRLRRQETDLTEFEPGDTAVLPQEKADELVTAGVAEKIRNVYRRQIIEFSARLRSINRRKQDIDLLMVEIRRDIATLDATNAKATEQIALETEHKRLLDEDLSKVTFERDGVARYGSSLFGQLAKTNNEVKQLYASNHTLNVELRQLTAKLNEEADKRTREATAGKE